MNCDGWSVGRSVSWSVSEIKPCELRLLEYIGTPFWQRFKLDTISYTYVQRTSETNKCTLCEMHESMRDSLRVCDGKSNPFQFNPLSNTTNVTMAVVTAIPPATAPTKPEYK